MLICMLPLIWPTNSKASVQEQKGTDSNGSIEIICSQSLNNVVNSLKNEYSNINPAVKFISGRQESGEINSNTIIFNSENDISVIPEGSGWVMPVGHTAVLPVFNQANPMSEIIAAQGISAGDVLKMASEKISWSQIFRGGKDIPLTVYAEDEQVMACLVKYCRTDISALLQIRIPEKGEFINSVQNDPYAIGFCRLADVLDQANGKIVEKLSFVPVDKNENDRIDSFEMIYGNVDELNRGIWIGKYPPALCSDVVAVMKEKPSDPNVISFLTWLISDGNQNMALSGFGTLAGAEKESTIAGLTNAKAITSADAGPGKTGIWLLLMSVLLFAVVISILLFGISGSRKVVDKVEMVPSLKAFSWNSVKIPKGIYFDKSHTWSFMEKDGKVRIGIDDFIQHVTGSLTRIMLKETGEQVRRGEKILTLVRNGKQLNIYSPVSGTIMEKNPLLTEDSSCINSSPFDEGWVYIIEPVNWEKEIRFMLMSEKYGEWIKEEFTRLKDFLATLLNDQKHSYAPLILQDGGDITDNILADLSPEDWEDFQIHFIDSSR